MKNPGNKNHNDSGLNYFYLSYIDCNAVYKNRFH